MYASDGDEAEGEDSQAEAEGEGGTAGEGSGRWRCEWQECTEEFGAQDALVAHLQKGE
jgi:hypothetical protein